LRAQPWNNTRHSGTPYQKRRSILREKWSPVQSKVSPCFYAHPLLYTLFLSRSVRAADCVRRIAWRARAPRPQMVAERPLLPPRALESVNGARGGKHSARIPRAPHRHAHSQSLGLPIPIGRIDDQPRARTSVAPADRRSAIASDMDLLVEVKPAPSNRRTSRPIRPPIAPDSSKFSISQRPQSMSLDRGA